MAISSCTISGNTAYTYTYYVRAHVHKFPLPHATLTFCSLFAGRCWCLCPGWHSGHLIVHHQWEHSFLCARSSPKVPTTLMGTLLTRLTRFSLAQLCERRFGQLYTVGACCRDLKFPPHTLLGFSRLCLMFRACACRAVVSVSILAQSRLCLP